MSKPIIYAAYADKPTGEYLKPWTIYEATKEGRQKAIKDGFTSLSVFSFSHPYEEGKPEPIRKGDLVLDFDNKESPFLAIQTARQFAKRLAGRYRLDLAHIRYFLSGNKGCHLVIPAVCFGGEEGDIYLPLIFKRMINFIVYGQFCDSESLAKILDMQMYKMGRGQCLRVENIKRENGRYKVPVTSDEFFTLDEAQLLQLTKAQRTLPEDQITQPYVSPALKQLYYLCKEIITRNSPGLVSKMLDGLFDCDFIKHCYAHPNDILEPLWFALIKNFLKLGKIGKLFIHEFSSGHKEYSYEETERKIKNSSKHPAAIGCQYIQEMGFTCPQYQNGECKAGCPANKWRGLAQKHDDNRKLFDVREDGVYIVSQDGPIKLCSRIDVLSKVRDASGAGYGRLLKIYQPDGEQKVIYVPMQDITANGSEKVKMLLSSLGVEFTGVRNTNSYLGMYLTGSSALPIGRTVDKTGWAPTEDACYILPDEQIGQSKESIFYRGSACPKHSVSGTHADWVENIGRSCQGNSLLVFATSFALSAPLLSKLNLEGCGLHIYGHSSLGKSTIAAVAGSVCGGEGNKGYMYQWRGTSNGFENLAQIYNDNLLVLDEMGQATPEAINELTYMLINGRGKERMQRDTTMRQTATWRLNVLSTGELTTKEKIEENGRLTAKAGQEARFIGIPIDAGKNLTAFPAIHEYKDAAHFSDGLKEAAYKFYGTPLREFLNKLCAGLESTIETVKMRMEEYQKEWLPRNASSQVGRVLKKFALIGVVGELAIEWDIFPYEAGEAAEAARYWFNVWIEARGGVANTEIIEALKRLKTMLNDCYTNHISPTEKYPLLHYKEKFESKCVGYMVGEDYFIYDEVLTKIYDGVSKENILGEMVKLDWIKTTRSGNPVERHDAFGTKRGRIFKMRVVNGLPTEVRSDWIQSVYEAADANPADFSGFEDP